MGKPSPHLALLIRPYEDSQDVMIYKVIDQTAPLASTTTQDYLLY